MAPDDFCTVKLRRRTKKKLDQLTKKWTPEAPARPPTLSDVVEKLVSLAEENLK